MKLYAINLASKMSGYAKVSNEKTLSLNGVGSHVSNILNEGATFTKLLLNTNVGKVTLASIFALGLTSGLVVVFTSLGISYIPILWFIISFVLNIGSFLSLFVSIVGIAIIFQARKNKDIFPFPAGIQNALQLYMCARLVLGILGSIDTSPLNFSQFGGNLVQIIGELRSAFNVSDVDRAQYSNVITQFSARIFHLSTGDMENVIVQISNLVDTISTLSTNGNLDFEIAKYTDELLITYNVCLNLLSGNLKLFSEDLQKRIKGSYAMGVSNWIFCQLDGDDPTSDDEIESITKSLMSHIEKATTQSRIIGKIFNFNYEKDKMFGAKCQLVEECEEMIQNLRKKIEENTFDISTYEMYDRLIEAFIADETKPVQFKKTDLPLDLLSPKQFNDIMNVNGKEWEELKKMKVLDLLNGKTRMFLNENSFLMQITFGELMDSMLRTSVVKEKYYGKAKISPVEKDEAYCLRSTLTSEERRSCFHKSDNLESGENEFSESDFMVYRTNILLKIHENCLPEDTKVELKIPVYMAMDADGRLWMSLCIENVSPEWFMMEKKDPIPGMNRFLFCAASKTASLKEDNSVILVS